jgi:hypothetical protein
MNCAMRDAVCVAGRRSNVPGVSRVQHFGEEDQFRTNAWRRETRRFVGVVVIDEFDCVGRWRVREVEPELTCVGGGHRLRIDNNVASAASAEELLADNVVGRGSR